MSHSNDRASPLLISHLSLIQELELKAGVLDLACGYGRNGLFLVKHNVPVVFADNNKSVLAEIAQKLGDIEQKSELWNIDLEQGGEDIFSGRVFDAVMVFNYLHRPLFPSIKRCIVPGGIIIYQTFTLEQRQFGRPGNGDFLLQPQELEHCFQGWDILQRFEGLKTDPDRAVASLIARKPA